MTVLAALAAALALTAAPALPPPGVVDGPTAQRVAAAGALVLDVRTPAEYAGGHIPGAKLLPYDQVTARAAELPAKDRPLLVYCRTGHRTAMAIAQLKQLGYAAIYDLKGLSNWTGPIERGTQRQ